MKKITLLSITVCLIMIISSCSTKTDKGTIAKITKQTIEQTIDSIAASADEATLQRANIGVNQLAKLWTSEDGTGEEFAEFCKKYFVTDPVELDSLFHRIDRNMEAIVGNFNKTDLFIKEPVQLSNYKPLPVDLLFSEFDISSHLFSDLYLNKIAHVCILNFPNYSLEQKNTLGENWTAKQWAYARLGDMFTYRIPSELNQNIAKTYANGDFYISNYNINTGCLINDNNEKIFDQGKSLISHWGLRDEIKANYADDVNGFNRQEAIYEVMKHIVYQTIPQKVINSSEYMWNPFSNKIYVDGAEQTFTAEPDTRYMHLLNNFKALSAVDKYTPTSPTFISRNFDRTMEISVDDVEALFKSLLSSEQVAKVAAIIKQDLKRDLRPYDIWYDGFKERSNIDQTKLSVITETKYPNTVAFEKDLPNILVKLGWQKDRAQEITKLIKVDAAVGSGHAWGAAMKNDYAHLRTRIAETGMDYKGYNIAIHEFGHNVEQTLSINDVPYWMLSGVPNNAFTEAAAFLFQNRDLEILLGSKIKDESSEHKNALDNFWSCYEIMGVALVDIEVWKWLYDNPNADEKQLKETVVRIAKDVWNSYYADVLGGKDEPILGIYSHMIDYPLYLSYYPIGHVIDFQLSQHFVGKDFAKEFERIYTQGRLTPQQWMKKAVGSQISIEPLLNAVDAAVETISN
ncbi:MAG: hypothetical protein WBH98_10195 [Bacteroidales bacterium]